MPTRDPRIVIPLADWQPRPACYCYGEEDRIWCCLWHFRQSQRTVIGLP